MKKNANGTLIEGVFNDGGVRKCINKYKSYMLNCFSNGKPMLHFLQWYVEQEKLDEVPHIKNVYTYMRYIADKKK
jgi:hypothetical protein